MKLTKIAQCIALMGIAGVAVMPAHAQSLQRVEITGSSIKRVQDEGATPIQTIKAEELLKFGVSTAEQLLSVISANGNGLDGLASNQGAGFQNGNSAGGANPHNAGASGASLRGLGSQYTLVLLNGRRIAAHGLNGTSADLNSLPIAAIDRIEVLKDGASAVYGADAIGGVINFILKKDFRGAEVSASSDRTQGGGGNINHAGVLVGAGDLDKDGFNFMASLTVDSNDRMRASQRSFHNGFAPDRGLAMDTVGTPFATIGRGASPNSSTAITGNFTYNGVSNRYISVPGVRGECGKYTDSVPYRGDITGLSDRDYACSYDYAKQWSLMLPMDKTNLVARGAMALGAGHIVSAEVVASRTKSTDEFTPLRVSSTQAGGLTYPANGPYYQNLAVLLPEIFKPTNTDPTDTRKFFDASKPLFYQWRCLECGPQQTENTTDASRALLAAEGTLGNWDYKAGWTMASSEGKSQYGSGYMFRDKFRDALKTGLINLWLQPGQSQTPEAMALINGSRAAGSAFYGGKATTTGFDATLSGQVGTFANRPVYAAFGMDNRKDKYVFNNLTATQPDVYNGATSPSLPEAARDINAVFAELQLPLAKGLELTLAARQDRYSDFGTTTNPKVSVRWQPSNALLVRGSYSTGFHAPDFESLYGAGYSSNFTTDVNDPVTCPGGVPLNGNDAGCGIRPDVENTSNPNLRPEKSKQTSIGFVVSPAPWLTASADLWRIELTDRISSLSGQALLANYSRYSQYVTRDADGQIESITAPLQNLAGDVGNGLDVNITMSFKNDMGRWTASLDGSYLYSFQTRLSEQDPWVERVGEFGDLVYGYNLKPKWKHSASLTWSRDAWSSTISQTYVSSYNSEVDGFFNGATNPLVPKKVDSYTLYNLFVTYSGIKNTRMTFGIKNILDTAPSFSAHNIDNVSGAGWDPRVGDPRGRAFKLDVNYKF